MYVTPRDLGHERLKVRSTAPHQKLRVVRLQDFLESIEPSDFKVPPLVHSTPSSNIYRILEEQKLLAAPCDVFREELCYLFVGRPAYKWRTEGEALRWQLPFVLVLRDLGELPVRRIYPFDTGAFAAGRMPDYLSLFDLGRYEIENQPSLISTLIELFFAGSERYVQGRARSLEEMRELYRLSPRHQEIEALAQLYGDRSNQKVDDRVRAIEIQIGKSIDLQPGNVLGIVLPQAYAQDVRPQLKELDCRVEAYAEFPLSVEGYFGLIYDAVNRIIRKSSRR